jgi:chromosome segregation ATPase
LKNIKDITKDQKNLLKEYEGDLKLIVELKQNYESINEELENEKIEMKERDEKIIEYDERIEVLTKKIEEEEEKILVYKKYIKDKMETEINLKNLQSLNQDLLKSIELEYSDEEFNDIQKNFLKEEKQLKLEIENIQTSIKNLNKNNIESELNKHNTEKIILNEKLIDSKTKNTLIENKIDKIVEKFENLKKTFQKPYE